MLSEKILGCITAKIRKTKKPPKTKTKTSSFSSQFIKNLRYVSAWMHLYVWKTLFKPSHFFFPKDLLVFDWLTCFHSLTFRFFSGIELHRNLANAYGIPLRNAAFPVASPEKCWRTDVKDPLVLLSSVPVNGLDMNKINS